MQALRLRMLNEGSDLMRKQKKELTSPRPDQIERPIPAKIYPAIDTDLARDNLENDLPAADLEDL